MKQKELCIRCGKPTHYHPNTPITLRRYYVEDSCYLCPLCYQELYEMVSSLQSMFENDLGMKPGGTDYSKLAIDFRISSAPELTQRSGLWFASI